MPLSITDLPLPESQYIKVAAHKSTIVLHHTAGSHRPDYVIQGWAQNVTRVATAYVIGGRGASDGSFDGKVYRAFDEKYWAYHLGLQVGTSYQIGQIEAQAVAIEICNWGYLKKIESGLYLNWVGQTVPANEVCTLAAPFRGFTHYHRYSEAQLAATRALILEIADRHNIAVQGQYTHQWFDLNQGALQGLPGLWSHTNYRRDKTDLSPQPALLDMLNSL